MSIVDPLRRTLAVASKELVHIRRDPQVLGFSLVLPAVLLLLFGYAISFDVENIPLAVVDRDQTAESRRLSDAFEVGGLFEVTARPDSAVGAEALFRQGTASTAIVVPRGYARSIARNEPADLQLLADGSDNNTASVAMGYASSISTQLLRPDGAAPNVVARNRGMFNPGLRSAVFIIPGLVALISALVSVIMTALTVAREYENGSMEQLFATPVGRLEIVLGKLLPYLGIGLVQITSVIAAGMVVFDVPFHGSGVLLFVASTIFVAAMLMQGLLISVVTRNQVLASQMALITSLLPTIMLSGFVFPIDNMPQPLQYVANVLPATHYMEAVRGILLRSNGLEHIWSNLVAISLFFVLMSALAVRKFDRGNT